MSSNEDNVTEYHVVYTEEPKPRWEVRWEKRRMGYEAWDKRVATSAAKEVAKDNRPSVVLIHDRKSGAVQSEIPYKAKSKATKQTK